MGVWYLSVIFLTLYFGVLILRMLIFTMFWVIGFDFWIFPNLNDEQLGLSHVLACSVGTVLECWYITLVLKLTTHSLDVSGTVASLIPSSRFTHGKRERMMPSCF